MGFERMNGGLEMRKGKDVNEGIGVLSGGRWKVVTCSRSSGQVLFS
jgi:hypothetical protein